eukprot:5282255-Amphidinium_carterae.2
MCCQASIRPMLAPDCAAAAVTQAERARQQRLHGKLRDLAVTGPTLKLYLESEQALFEWLDTLALQIPSSVLRFCRSPFRLCRIFVGICPGQGHARKSTQCAKA